MLPVFQKESLHSNLNLETKLVVYSTELSDVANRRRQFDINYLLLCLEGGAECTSAVTVFRDLGGSLGPQSSSHSFLNFSSSAVILEETNAVRH